MGRRPLAADVDTKLLINALVYRVKYPEKVNAAEKSMDDFISGASYKEESVKKRPMIEGKKMSVYINPEDHKALKKKLIDDDISFNALAGELVKLYLDNDITV